MRPQLLWLDDLRPAPPGWVWARSVNEAIRVIGNPTIAVSHVSLDHDLGDYENDGGDGPRFTDWMAGNNQWPTLGLRVHSSNPMGAETMLRTTDRYSPFPVGYTRTRGRAPDQGWPPALATPEKGPRRWARHFRRHTLTIRSRLRRVQGPRDANG